jgi:glutathionyl-hydroquinone reductase
MLKWITKRVRKAQQLKDVVFSARMAYSEFLAVKVEWDKAMEDGEVSNDELKAILERMNGAVSSFNKTVVDLHGLL